MTCQEINFKNNWRPKIVTFGSCLSRYVANQYTYLFGGVVVSSVFHNRSDLFINKFMAEDGIDRYNTNLDELKKEFESLTEEQEKILRNQLPSTIGLHNLEKGEVFFKALENEPDILILDNYIDMVGRAAILSNGEKYFITIKDNSKEVDELISVESSILNFCRIIKRIRLISQKTKIVFITFPGDEYPEENVRRARFLDFRDYFYSSDVDFLIRARLINHRYATTDKQHFKGAFYSSLATMIYQNFYNAY